MEVPHPDERQVHCDWLLAVISAHRGNKHARTRQVFIGQVDKVILNRV